MNWFETSHNLVSKLSKNREHKNRRFWLKVKITSFYHKNSIFVKWLILLTRNADFYWNTAWFPLKSRERVLLSENRPKRGEFPRKPPKRYFWTKIDRFYRQKMTFSEPFEKGTLSIKIGHFLSRHLKSRKYYSAQHPKPTLSGFDTRCRYAYGRIQRRLMGAHHS